MRSYRCYLLTEDHIIDVRVVDCETDADALLEADRILATSSCTAAEVWDRQRQVSMIARPSAA